MATPTESAQAYINRRVPAIMREQAIGDPQEAAERAGIEWRTQSKRQLRRRAICPQGQCDSASQQAEVNAARTDEQEDLDRAVRDDPSRPYPASNAPGETPVVGKGGMMDDAPETQTPDPTHARERYLASNHYEQAQRVRTLVAHLGYDPDHLTPHQRLHAVREYERQVGITFDPNFLAMLAQDGAGRGIAIDKSYGAKSMDRNKRKLRYKRDKVKKVMHEFGEGTLQTGSGHTVTDHDQAVAIALSQAGLSNQKDMNGAAMPAMSSIDATTGGSFIPPASFAGGSDKPFHWGAKPFHRRKLTRRMGLKSTRPHKFSSTQVNIADAGYSRSIGSPMPRLKELAGAIADEDLADDGREDEPHVTVKYGLHTSDPEEVRELASGFGPVRLKLGKVSLFKRRDDKQYDVVKIDVDSPDLHRLNELISNSLEHTDAHPDYKPHLTLAYVKPGMGDKYISDGLNGHEVVCNKLIFSNQQGQRTIIDLARRSDQNGMPVEQKNLGQLRAADPIPFARVLSRWYEPTLAHARALLLQQQEPLEPGGAASAIQQVDRGLMEDDPHATGSKLELLQKRPRWNESTRLKLDEMLKRNPSALGGPQRLLTPLLRRGESLTTSNKSYRGKAKGWRDQPHVKSKTLPQDGEGRWVTIGGQMGEDGKRHGGSPVFIKDGKIAKGAPGLVGRKLDNMSEKPADQSRRAENKQSREYQSAKYAKRARKEGIEPKHLHSLASEIASHDQGHVERRKQLLSDARKTLTSKGYDARALTTNLRSGRVEDKIPYFDELADEMQKRYPEQFADHDDAESRLKDLFAEGNPEEMSQEDAYEKALEQLLAMKAEQQEDPYSFEFGANAKGDEGGDEDEEFPFGANSPPPKKEQSRQEVRAAAAAKRYENRAQHARGGGLFGGEDMQAREGFRKLPDGAGVLFVEGEFEGKTGKIVHDFDPSTGHPRIVAEVEGRKGLVPVTPDAIEPLDAHLSWRTEHASGPVKQGSLYTADQFLPKRSDKNEGFPFGANTLAKSFSAWRAQRPEERFRFIKEWRDQPRIPAGSSEGGRWTEGSGGSGESGGERSATQYPSGFTTHGSRASEPGQHGPNRHLKVPQHFDSMRHSMPVGSKVKARRALHVGGTFDAHGNYTPISQFAGSQEELEVLGHRGGEGTGLPAMIHVRNGQGQESWIQRSELRGITGGRGHKLPKHQGTEDQGAAESHHGPQRKPLIEAMRKQWDKLCAPEDHRFYCFQKDYAPALARDLVFRGAPQFNEEEMSITFPFASSQARDRVGDYLDVNGIDTANHRQNPVAYLDHGKQPGEYSQPIGKCESPSGEYTVKIYPDLGLAVATVYLDRDPENKVARRVFSQFKQGLLRKGSIGYKPSNKPKKLPADPDNGIPEGQFLDRTELLEVTLCGLPCQGVMDGA